MTVRLSMYLPTWPCDLARRAARLPPGAHVLLTRADHGRELVASCCASCLRAGARPGMTLAHARALLPAGGGAAFVRELDPASDARALRRLACALTRYTPIVGLDAPDGLWLDATGCDALYRGIGRMVARIGASVRKLGIACVIGAAPTWGAAWALARFGAPPRRAEWGGLRGSLAPLPAGALRIDSATLDALEEVGLTSIGQLLELPRGSLASRFGDELMVRLDQALGSAAEIVTPVRVPEPVMEEVRFDGSTTRLEDLQHVARGLVEGIAAELSRLGRGCRRLDLTLRRTDLPPLTLTARASRPTRDPRHWWNLLRPMTERAQLGFGVEGVRARAGMLAPMPEEQRTAWREEAAGPSAEELARLIDVVAARLGPPSVRRVVALESHIPERSFDFVPLERLDGGGAAPRCGAAMVGDADRPSLMREPAPVRVVSLVPDGPIAALTLPGAAAPSRAVASIGPERIEPEWWRHGGAGAGGGRDYFKVQTESGRWLWVFRDLASGSWFLHGEWA